MSHKHDHDECEHKNLKYCKKCDVIYCVNCDREWPSVKWNYSYTQPYRTWTSDGTTYIAYTEETCGHTGES